MRIRWTVPAADDLTNINNYLQKHYPQFAESTVRAIYKHVRSLKTMPNRGRRQKEAAKLLGVKQLEISALMRAKFSRFSQERLIGFLNKLDRKVTIQISRHRGKEPYQKVTLAP
jgi:predicted XRE-type DNA-binding protein